MGGAGRVDPQEDLDLGGALLGDLLDRLLGDGPRRTFKGNLMFGVWEL